jgi:hypothetical protein
MAYDAAFCQFFNFSTLLFVNFSKGLISGGIDRKVRLTPYFFTFIAENVKF